MQRQVSARTDQQQIELVAIDIDGTLLDSQHRLSPGAEAAIREARERGVKVTLVSGRGKMALRCWVDALGIRVPYVCSSGGYIEDPVSGEVLYQDQLDRDDVALVVETARQYGACIFFDEPDHFVAEGEAGAIEAVQVMTGIAILRSSDVLRDRPEPPTKIFLTGRHEVLEQAESRILNRTSALFLAYSEPTFLEITPRGSDKASALARLAGRLGIPLNRVAAIGDGANDIGMFRIAGLGIAMGNAPAEVKAEADIVAPANDSGGVAWALREVILGRVA
jgi:Cof subfamily protein (haloacid dehalogenase superfamily)